MGSLALFATSAQAAVVYLEDFEGVTTLEGAGWTGVHKSGSNSTTQTNMIAAATDVEGLKRIYSGEETWYVSDAPELATITQVRWLERDINRTYRLGLEVGGTWYLSDVLTTTILGGFDPHDGSHPGITIADFSSFAAWGAGTSTTGAPADDTEAWDLSTLGTAGALPAGNITRIGIYGIVRGHRFDYVEVSGTLAGIPEPSAALLGGLGFLCLLRRRR